MDAQVARGVHLAGGMGWEKCRRACVLDEGGALDPIPRCELLAPVNDKGALLPPRGGGFPIPGGSGPGAPLERRGGTGAALHLAQRGQAQAGDLDGKPVPPVEAVLVAEDLVKGRERRLHGGGEGRGGGEVDPRAPGVALVVHVRRPQEEPGVAGDARGLQILLRLPLQLPEALIQLLRAPLPEGEAEGPGVFVPAIRVEEARRPEPGGEGGDDHLRHPQFGRHARRQERARPAVGHEGVVARVLSGARRGLPDGPGDGPLGGLEDLPGDDLGSARAEGAQALLREGAAEREGSPGQGAGQPAQDADRVEEGGLLAAPPVAERSCLRRDAARPQAGDPPRPPSGGEAPDGQAGNLHAGKLRPSIRRLLGGESQDAVLDQGDLGGGVPQVEGDGPADAGRAGEGGRGEESSRRAGEGRGEGLAQAFPGGYGAPVRAEGEDGGVRTGGLGRPHGSLSQRPSDEEAAGGIQQSGAGPRLLAAGHPAGEGEAAGGMKLAEDIADPLLMGGVGGGVEETHRRCLDARFLELAGRRADSLLVQGSGHLPLGVHASAHLDRPARRGQEEGEAASRAARPAVPSREEGEARRHDEAEGERLSLREGIRRGGGRMDESGDVPGDGPGLLQEPLDGQGGGAGRVPRADGGQGGEQGAVACAESEGVDEAVAVVQADPERALGRHTAHVLPAEGLTTP